MDTLERLKSLKQDDFFKVANLHAHSSFSDGEKNFEELVEQAKNLGLKHFSICDHNTVRGYDNFDYRNCEILIPAVEFDCQMDLTYLHIIGYGIDPENEALRSFCTNCENQTKVDIVRLFHLRDPKTVIQAIKKAGGVAVLAHPCCCWTPCLTRYIKKLKSFGLEGVEVYYPYERLRGIIKFHSRKKALEITEKLGLIKTGGTDCHRSLDV